jgi:hypothetical protein
MRDRCNCGHMFTLERWVSLPTAYYQTYHDDDSSKPVVVHQHVDCPRCGSTLVAAEIEVVRRTFGPRSCLDKVAELDRETAFTRGMVIRRRAASAWQISTPASMHAVAL